MYIESHLEEIAIVGFIGRLASPEYFFHGTKKDTFSSKELKRFVEFMKETPVEVPYNTYWEFAVSMWNVNNSSEKIKGVLMPDYAQLNKHIEKKGKSL